VETIVVRIEAAIVGEGQAPDRAVKAVGIIGATGGWKAHLKSISKS
jgi:hypothetical protein